MKRLTSALRCSNILFSTAEQSIPLRELTGSGSKWAIVGLYQDFDKAFDRLLYSGKWTYDPAPSHSTQRMILYFVMKKFFLPHLHSVDDYVTQNVNGFQIIVILLVRKLECNNKNARNLLFLWPRNVLSAMKNSEEMELRKFLTFIPSFFLIFFLSTWNIKK